MHTSIGELIRIGIDALRGQGFTFFQADALTHTLAWAEGVHHRGWRFMREEEERIAEGIGRPFTLKEHAVGSVPCFFLDAGGKSVLESGLRALDLGNAAARQSGRGAVFVRDTFGMFLLGDLAFRSHERGLATLVLYSSPSSDSLFEGTGAILATPEAGGSMSKFAVLENEKPDSSATLVRTFQPLMDNVAAGPLATEIASFFDRSRQSPRRDGSFVLLSIRPDAIRDWPAVFKVFDDCVGGVSGASWTV
ncbi:MAG: hypothetical protein AB7K04_16390, partial [Pseudorhodoplanes sp.]